MTNDTQLDPNMFKLAVDSSTDHITLSDENGIIIYANKAVEHITGFAHDELIGKKAGSKELWGGLMSQEFYQRLWDRIKYQKKPFQGEFLNKRKDGSTYHTSGNIFPVVSDHGNIDFFVEVHHDISRRKELEKAKTDFLSFAGHKLQTPLTVSRWSLELLEQSSGLDERQKSFIRDANLANKKMIELISELLSMVRIELGKFHVAPKPLDPVEIMKQTLHDVHPIVDKKRLIVKNNFDKIPLIPLDKKILGSIYESLVSNAVYFTPDGGHIEIAIVADTENDEFHTTVSDSGFGISPAERPKIFSKFFRSKHALLADPQGSGLGLFNAKRFVDMSGGHIWFESPSSIGNSDHPGVAFHVSFPLSGMVENINEEYKES